MDLSIGKSLWGITVICCLALCAVNAAVGQSSTNVEIVVKLVSTDLSLKPVPKFVFRFVPESGGADVEVVTSFEGTGSISLPPGSYRIKSPQPLTFEGQQFTWDVPVIISGRTQTIELSNDNAEIAGAAAVDGAGLASSVFRQVRDGVVTIESEVSGGTGFFVDPSGLVLTNAHVTAGSRFFAVRMDDEHRYRAHLVFDNPTDDVAVLLVHPDVVKGRPILELSNDSPDAPTCKEGEPAFAVGSPLNQEKIITSGIVSKVERGAIISDVLIQAGNSGGPLLDSKCRVIGINTFGILNPKGGSSISGSIRIWKAYPVLEEARKRMSSMVTPIAEPLPPLPKTRYPADALERIVLSEDFDGAEYVVTTKRFNVYFNTPPASLYFSLRNNIDAAKGRLKRREKRKVQEENTYDPIRDVPGWSEYAGNLRALVEVVVEPRAKQTIGSRFAVGLIGAQGLARYRYAGDFDTLRLLRGGSEISYITIGRFPRGKVFYSDTVGAMSDVAYVGVAQFTPDAFRPPADKDEKVILEIVDETRPDDTIKVELSEKMLNTIWRDFSPLRVSASAREHK